MKLQLIREEFLPTCTIGRLFVDGEFECYTLEDAVRETSEPVPHWKIPGVTAIPKGHYSVRITMSNRFKKLLPLLDDVPGFAGVRIHSGNTDADTEGCILVGAVKLATRIDSSRVAFSKLFPQIHRALDAGEAVTLTIEGERP